MTRNNQISYALVWSLISRSQTIKHRCAGILAMKPLFWRVLGQFHEYLQDCVPSSKFQYRLIFEGSIHTGEHCTLYFRGIWPNQNFGRLAFQTLETVVLQQFSHGFYHLFNCWYSKLHKIEFSSISELRRLLSTIFFPSFMPQWNTHPIA